MLLHLHSPIAGPNFSYAIGDIVEWPDEDDARRMIDKGVAQELTPETAAETSKDTRRPIQRHRQPERAVKRPAAEKATV